MTKPPLTAKELREWADSPAGLAMLAEAKRRSAERCKDMFKPIDPALLRVPLVPGRR